MADIATVVVQDITTGVFSLDLFLDGADLYTEYGLATAIWISLFSDREARADDKLPDDTLDRRGWWGDSFPTGGGAKRDLIGSRLWLLQGKPQNGQTASLAKAYVREALAWLIEDEVAQSIQINTAWIARDKLSIGITISQRGAAGSLASMQFDYVWSPSLVMGGDTGQPIQVGPPQALDTILTEGGTPILSESAP